MTFWSDGTIYKHHPKGIAILRRSCNKDCNSMWLVYHIREGFCAKWDVMNRVKDYPIPLNPRESITFVTNEFLICDNTEKISHSCIF